jgi:hypothetical protein
MISLEGMAKIARGAEGINMSGIDLGL